MAVGSCTFAVGSDPCGMRAQTSCPHGSGDPCTLHSLRSGKGMSMVAEGLTQEQATPSMDGSTHSLRLTESGIGQISAEVSSKAKRYDRQLRIWGMDGQQRLESCKVCLLNCGPTGAEALKNLVLGGIASFTIVDEAKVRNDDLTKSPRTSSSNPPVRLCGHGIVALGHWCSSAWINIHPANDGPKWLLHHVLLAPCLLLANQAAGPLSAPWCCCRSPQWTWEITSW